MRMQKSLIIAALVLCATGAIPALASPQLTANAVPRCSASTPHDPNSSAYEWQLSRPGYSLQSLDVWNGCLKAIYTDAKGHTTTVFYDPDSLKQVGQLG